MTIRKESLSRVLAAVVFCVLCLVSSINDSYASNQSTQEACRVDGIIDELSIHPEWLQRNGSPRYVEEYAKVEAVTDEAARCSIFFVYGKFAGGDLGQCSSKLSKFRNELKLDAGEYCSEQAQLILLHGFWIEKQIRVTYKVTFGGMVSSDNFELIRVETNLPKGSEDALEALQYSPCFEADDSGILSQLTELVAEQCVSTEIVNSVQAEIGDCSAAQYFSMSFPKALAIGNNGACGLPTATLIGDAPPSSTDQAASRALSKCNEWAKDNSCRILFLNNTRVQ